MTNGGCVGALFVLALCVITTRGQAVTLDRSLHNVAVFIPPSTGKTGQQIARDHGFEYGGTIAGVAGYHLFRQELSRKDRRHGLETNPQVEWFEDQVPLARATRKINVAAVRRSVQDHRSDPNKKNMTEIRRESTERIERERSEEEEVKKREEGGDTGPSSMGGNGGGVSHDTAPPDVTPADYGSWAPRDPLVADQWHLGNANDLPGADRHYIGSPVNLNVFAAWKNGYTGHGVTIAVVDDGLETHHPDIRPNYIGSASWDVNEGDDDPNPAITDSHGTAAGGVAAAASNSECGVGVAYRANLAGVRLLGGPATDSEEASALAFRCTAPVGTHGQGIVNDIYTNSWGPIDNGQHLDGPGRITRQAMRMCIEQGRDGLGSVYVWAGGNGRNRVDNSNYDGYANSPYTIAVAAVEDYGDVTYYSEPGANVLVCAPSSGGSTSRKITTIDLSGRNGVSYGDCRSDFGGTSASSPMVAGVVALMLGANPGLSWRDVQHILVRTSRPRLGRGSSPWITNVAGFAHSDDFGFGLVDAGAATDLATRWSPVKSRVLLSSGDLDLDNLKLDPGVMVELHWNASTSLTPRFLEHVQLGFIARTPNGHGWLALELCSPTGTCSILQNTNPGRQPNVQWTYTTVKHWGEDVVYRDVQGRYSGPATRTFTVARTLGEASFIPPNMWYLRAANTCNVRSDSIQMVSWRIDFWGYTTSSQRRK